MGYHINCSITNTFLWFLQKSQQPQKFLPCRQNAVFLVATSKLKDDDDVKSDLNGALRKCHEVKYKLFGILERKVVPNKKCQLTEHELMIRIHCTENIYELIRSFVSFEDKRGCIFHNRFILQYYINKDMCGNVDSVTYQIPKHGNAKI